MASLTDQHGPKRCKDDGPIRVLIVDDVKSARDLLTDILGTDRRFQVVGALSDGREAVEAAMRLQPDLITMDIRLPGLDGFLAVEQILAQFTVPIVMITASLSDPKEKLFQALNAGALDVLDKQELYLWRTRPEVRNSFLRRLRTLASTRLRPVPVRAPAGHEGHRAHMQPSVETGELPFMVVIASSTGGPSALMSLLKEIPAGVNAAFLVVQHMSPGFLEGLARWLDSEVELTVKKAEHGDPLKPGVALLAPEDYHMLVTDDGLIRLNKSLPIGGHRPSAEVLFDSVSHYYGTRGIGIVLTGMGSDGASGLKRLRARGAHTIAQDEETSIVFGMPRAAIDLGAAEMVLPLEKIAPQLMAWISKG
ncbi:MAG: chemotaxis-specific protein-glutamate methyltransferase CheB [Syntrophobacteria bacterium]